MLGAQASTDCDKVLNTRHARKPTVNIMSPLETQLNCTAGDVFRNSFTKKEDETEDEEQSYYEHGHDTDHGGQDEEEDDQLGD